MGFTKDGQDPRILDVTHHDNFISEYKTNLRGDNLIEYYNFIRGQGKAFDRTAGQNGAVTDQQIFVHELPPDYWHDNLSRSVYRAWNFLTEDALNDYGKK